MYASVASFLVLYPGCPAYGYDDLWSIFFPLPIDMFFLKMHL